MESGAHGRKNDSCVSAKMVDPRNLSNDETITRSSGPPDKMNKSIFLVGAPAMPTARRKLKLRFLSDSSSVCKVPATQRGSNLKLDNSKIAGEEEKWLKEMKRWKDGKRRRIHPFLVAGNGRQVVIVMAPHKVRRIHTGESPKGGGGASRPRPS